MTDLIPGERPIGSYLANLVIRSEEYGLDRFPDGALLAGNEAIGGRLHLTSRRLAFEAHKVNRVQGRLTLFLPAIVQVGDTRVFLRRHVTVTTSCRTYRFGVWRRRTVVDAINRARGELSRADVESLRSLLTRGHESAETDILSALSTQEAREWLARSEPSS